MNHWTIALLGLAAMALLFWINVPRHANEIQAGIADSLSRTMGRGSRKNVSFSVDGRYVTLTGSVETEKARTRAAFIASRSQLISSVDNQIEIVAPVPPASN